MDPRRVREGQPRLQVAFDTYQVVAQGQRLPRDVELRNVVAVLPGASPRRIYVSAHYDTVARRTDGGGGETGFDWTRADNDAPGANDDGSGTALVIELARVFAQSGLQFDATIVFIALAGEEQGLVGAKLHAQRAAAEGWRIDAVLNNDIVGNSRGGTGASEGDRVRVFSEGPEDSPSRQVARYVRRVAMRYQPGHEVTLVARADRFGRGGDHTAFNQHGFAGVRVTEANEAYQRQHTVADTADGVDPSYLQRNARVNAAALAGLALAPPAPVVVNERGAPRLSRGASGYDAALVLDRQSRGRRLSHPVAPGVGAGLGARTDRGCGHRSDPAAAVGRRRRHRRGGDRTRRPRKPRQRVRRADQARDDDPDALVVNHRARRHETHGDAFLGRESRRSRTLPVPTLCVFVSLCLLCVDYAWRPVLTASRNWVSALATQLGMSMNSIPAR